VSGVVNAETLSSDIATVTELDGRAFAFEAGRSSRRLAKGDGVGQKARIVTAKNAALTLVFTDETELVLGSETTIRLDDYEFDPNAVADHEPIFSTAILSGVVRAVTGLIAKRRPTSVRFGVNVATIGVRGTHFTAEVQGSSALIILLAQAAGGGANAIDVSNQYGTVEIDQTGYGTEIPDANSPPSPPRKMRTTNTMSRILRSTLTTGRVRIPRSRMH